MDNMNISQLIHHMSLLGCFHAEKAESSICKQLLAKLIPKNESDRHYNHLQNKNDDYSVVNPVVCASYALAIFLNCVLLWTMYKDPLKRFRTPSSLLVFNLAISDLLGACFSLVIAKEISKAGYHTSDSTTLHLPWLVVTAAQSSYHTVILVSCDRYTAIAYPFRYRSMIRTKNVSLIILACWLLAFSISTPLFYIPQVSKITTGTETYAINTFILISIILVLYPLTHSSLRRQRKQVLTMNASNKTLRTQKLKVEKNFVNTMYLVSFFLLLFTFPYAVTFFFTIAECNSCILNNYFLTIWMYFRFFFSIHFAVNPVIYALRLSCYRKSLSKLLLSPLKNRRTVRPRQTRSTSKQHSDADRQNKAMTQSDTRM